MAVMNTKPRNDIPGQPYLKPRPTLPTTPTGTAPPVGGAGLTPTGGAAPAPPRYAQPSLTPTGGGMPSPAQATPTLGAPAPTLGAPAATGMNTPGFQFTPQQTPAAQALGNSVMAQQAPAPTQGANTSTPTPNYGPSNTPPGWQQDQQGPTPAAQALGQATAGPEMQQAKDQETAQAVQGYLQTNPQAAQASQQTNTEFATQIEGLMTSITDLRTQLGQDDGSQAMIANWYADVEASIGKAYQTMMADMQKNMGAEDPSVKAAIGVIHEEVSLQRQELMAELDARGLSQSGILVEMNLRMSKNELSQTQQLVAGKLSEMKTAMMTAISNFAGYRANLLAQVFTARTQALQGSMDRKANLQNTLLTTQANLANTIGARDNSQLNAQVQREGYRSAEQIAADNNRTTLTSTGMQATSAQSIANLNSTTQLTVGREQNASAEGIAAKNRTSAENIAQWGIDADVTKWQAQIASNEKLTGLQIGAAAELAKASGKISIQIAEMQGKNQVTAGQMNNAADIATNVLLPMIMSGKMTKEEAMKNLGGLQMDPNVRNVYDQILGVMPGGAVAPGAPPVVPGVTTPTFSNNPTVAADQKTTYTAQVQNDIAKDQASLTDLQGQLSKLEAGYGSASTKDFPIEMGSGFGLAPTQKELFASDIERLMKEIEKLKTRIAQNQKNLSGSGVNTPTTQRGRTAQ